MKVYEHIQLTTAVVCVLMDVQLCNFKTILKTRCDEELD